MKKQTKIKQLKDFPDYYITTTGEVLSFKFNKVVKLKPCYKIKGQRGYIQVHLYKNGVRHNKYVHRLMATTWLGEYEHLEVNHIDLDKHNNDISNLEWVTRQDNIAHYWNTINNQ